jgi:hypothetical protein
MKYKLTNAQVSELKTITSTATNKFFRAVIVMDEADFTVNFPEQKVWFDANVENLEKVIPSVKPVYMRKALRTAGLMDVIQSILDMEGNEDAKDAFEYTLVFNRADVLLNQMAVALGLTVEQVDGIFLDAYNLQIST